MDRETGLVWEKSPATDLPDWRGAAQICVGKNVGGRRGWRLPSIPELASLVDPTVASPGPTLPMAHPFTNVQTSQQKGYWTATTMAVLPGNDAWIAWEVFFYNGVVSGNAKMLTDYAWCVHGPMNADTY